MLTASCESIQVWLTKVFPSLFPFMAACNILLQTGAAKQIGRFLQPLTKWFFSLDGIAAFPFFIGLLSGYPMGAKITAQLYAEKQISLKDAQHILVISNNPGPLFLIGTVGTGFFGMPFYGYLLLASTFLSTVFTGILLRSHPKDTLPRSMTPSQNTPPLAEILPSAISDSMNTLLLIGGYLILFGTFSEGLKQAGLFSFLAETLFFLPLSADTLQGFCSGLLEMTNGTYLLSRSEDPLLLRLMLTAFLVSFSGLSILGQTFGILSAVPISKKDYLKGQLLKALFSSLFFWFFFLFFEQKAQKAVPVCSFVTETAFTLSFLWLLPSLFCIGALFRTLFCRK